MRKLPTRLAVTALAVIAVVTPAVTSTASGSDKEDSIAVIRQATAKYHDVAVALSDGYVPVSPCEASPAGTMGIHYLKPSLVGQQIDLRHPQLLLYLPTADGPQLIGVEYFKPDADQNLATDSDRPYLLGRPFDGPMPGHDEHMPIHYDLHVWVWKHNPAGMFAVWNPALSC
jgi:hypothetical protein